MEDENNNVAFYLNGGATGSGAGTAYFGGNVGIGTASSYPLDVNGTARIGTLNLTNALAVAQGGTGATTAAAARTNLGVDTRHLRFTIVDPYTAYGKSATICVVPAIDQAITVTKLQVTTNSSSYEVAGDLKYADAFIGLANATVINDFDTSSGVRTDTTITNASVASGKNIYISFDSQPSSSLAQVSFDVTYTY